MTPPNDVPINSNMLNKLKKHLVFHGTSLARLSLPVCIVAGLHVPLLIIDTRDIPAVEWVDVAASGAVMARFSSWQ